MLRPNQAILGALTVVLLSLGWAAPARAAIIPFTYTGEGTGTLLSPPPLVGFQFTGVTSFLPFGEGSLLLSGVADFGTVNPDGSTPAAGTFVYTFAGDDSFFGTFTQSVFPPDPLTGIQPFTNNETITGGTGVFLGASGSASGTGSIVITSPTTTTSSFSASGTITTAVPEPSSLLLLALGSLGLFGCARRRGKPVA